MPNRARAGAIRLATAAALAALLSAPARSETLRVPGDFAGIQLALDASADGDRIEVAPGVYDEHLDFRGKAVHVVGAGESTVVQGSGSGPVVQFVSGETAASILDSLVVTGGRAQAGGGVAILGSSPTLVRVAVVGNRAASKGSGIFVEGPATPLLYNLVVAYNLRVDGGDPHQVEVDGAAPAIVNVTVARGDSNGLLLRGDSPAVVRNGIFSRNGSRVGGRRRGRGICDFSSGADAEIAYNVFHRNRRSALLRGGRDWRRIERFQRETPDDPAIFGNRDGRPGFLRGPRARLGRQALADLLLRPCARARDAGDPDPRCRDLDGTRNDAGHAGGPFAAPSRAVPGPDACGLAAPGG